ncbi:hypothetical protein [Actinomadura fibrosa]|uniref:Uncharacterized protein n=1 Tax=Actinomadura fibrosa TaxID=111802 RepID=A0ABW2XHH0_9ACTN|nr:hypothetical protein [Actinomadura fibrosa]
MQSARLFTLLNALKAHGHDVELADFEPLMSVAAPVDDLPTKPVKVRCEPRMVCGGELWFHFEGAEAIAPADDAHIADVVTAVKGKLARPT